MLLMDGLPRDPFIISLTRLVEEEPFDPVTTQAQPISRWGALACQRPRIRMYMRMDCYRRLRETDFSVAINRFAKGFAPTALFASWDAGTASQKALRRDLSWAVRYGKVPVEVALVDRAHRFFAKPASDPGGDQREGRRSYFTRRGHRTLMNP